MENKIKGKYSGKEYYAKDVVRILDPYQSAVYWASGLEPVDIYSSRDFKTNKAVIVYVFDREKSKNLFDLWCRHKLK